MSTPDMNKDTEPTRKGPVHGTAIEPGDDTSPGKVADELLAHGLLSYLNIDTRSSQDRRVGRVMTAIDAERFRPHKMPPAWRLVRTWSALAAAIALACVMAYFGMPGETSAQATVQAAIQAMQQPGDRRYEVRICPQGRDAPEEGASAVIDTRSPGLLLLQAHAPEGHTVFAGRDAEGGWAIRPDGGIERDHPEVAWPRWSRLGEESLFADSVDRLLDEMTKGYTLERLPAAKVDGRGDAEFQHVVGVKKQSRGPGPQRIEIWIDPATRVVERLEMHWEKPADAAQTPPSDGPEAAGGEGRAGRPGDGEDGPPDRDRRPGRGPRPPFPPPPPGFGPAPEGGPGDGPDGAGISRRRASVRTCGRPAVRSRRG